MHRVRRAVIAQRKLRYAICLCGDGLQVLEGGLIPLLPTEHDQARGNGINVIHTSLLATKETGYVPNPPPLPPYVSPTLYPSPDPWLFLPSPTWWCLTCQEHGCWGKGMQQPAFLVPHTFTSASSSAFVLGVAWRLTDIVRSCRLTGSRPSSYH